MDHHIQNADSSLPTVFDKKKKSITWGASQVLEFKPAEKFLN
jgi:hypothetical protein